MVRVGLVTLVIILVDSVTSTCLRSSLGDMRTVSGPMSAVSSGGLPGQRGTTRGSSAAAGVAATRQFTSKAAAKRVIDPPWLGGEEFFDRARFMVSCRNVFPCVEV